MAIVQPHHVVIVGGGFGGLNVARALGRQPVRVTLVDRRNFHLFQPLLYQVATGGLSPGDITSPLRSVLRHGRSTSVLLAEVVSLDPEGRRVILRDGELSYDTLVVAAGSRHHYFGHDAWATRAPGLKTIEDATRIRAAILTAFEQVERTDDPLEQQALLAFVVVGGGPTGVELAGAIGELARTTLRGEFRRFRTEEARILLVEGAERLIPSYPVRLSSAAARALQRLGVDVRLRTLVADVDDGSVTLERQGAEDEVIRTRTVLWAAGIEASPLARELGRKTGVALDAAGRVAVGPDCSIPGHPEIFVIGDMARFVPVGADGAPLPGVAPVAMQQGRYVARRIADRLHGRPTPPFRYRNRGSLAVIGRAAAVADLGWLRFSGYPAWLLWLFVHIMYLVGFQNRLLVFIQWAFCYFTRNRGARLITGPAS
jgi:NADH dehydrogenase